MFSVGIFAEYIKDIDYQKLFWLCCVQTASPLTYIISRKMGQKYPIFPFYAASAEKENISLKAS